MFQWQFSLVVIFVTYRQSWSALVKGHCTAIEVDDSDWRFAVFERKETDKALANHMIDSKFVLTEMECSLACLRHGHCKSYNYQDEGKQHLCELNNQAASITPRDLLRRKGFSYYGITSQPCQNTFCQNGGTCQMTFTGQATEYCCYCKEQFQGDICQHFKGFRFTNKSSGDYASVNVKGNTNITALSVCLRFKSSEPNHGTSTPISYATNDTAVAVQLNSKGSVRIAVKDQSRSFDYVSLMDDKWHHLCFSWEHNDGNLTLYVDGLLIEQQQGFQAGLSFHSTGILFLGQHRNTTNERFILDESYTGDITDVNIWSTALSQSVVMEQSRECFGHVGDLVAWTAFSTGHFQFQDSTNIIPTVCEGFDLSANFDLEITERSTENYVLIPMSSIPALSAFTVSLFVSFTDAGSKTYLNYFKSSSFNEIFIYERNNHFIINLKQNKRQHNFVIAPDGLWHHVAVTWENVNGTYEIFVDGQSKAVGGSLITGSTIKAGGIMVVGNDKDGGGFEYRDAFVGNISRVNVWDYVLTRETIALLSRRCGQEVGGTVSWKHVKTGAFYGEVNIREPSSCRISV